MAQAPKPRRPRVEFLAGLTQDCELCGPYCAQSGVTTHRGFFRFYDSYGQMLFEICSGCMSIAGDTYRQAAEAGSLSDITGYAEGEDPELSTQSPDEAEKERLRRLLNDIDLEGW